MKKDRSRTSPPPSKKPIAEESIHVTKIEGIGPAMIGAMRTWSRIPFLWWYRATGCGAVGVDEAEGLSELFRTRPEEGRRALALRALAFGVSDPRAYETLHDLSVAGWSILMEVICLALEQKPGCPETVGHLDVALEALRHEMVSLRPLAKGALLGTPAAPGSWLAEHAAEEIANTCRAELDKIFAASEAAS